MNLIKITNCTTETGGGKKPMRLRHNQNVTIAVSAYLYNKDSDFIRKHFFYKWTKFKEGLYFRATTNSKIKRIK